MQYLYLMVGQEIATLSKHDNTSIIKFVHPAAFPDAAFRAYVFTTFDTNEDGILSQAECDIVTTISVNTEDIH